MIKRQKGESSFLHGNKKMTKSDIEYDETPNCNKQNEEKKKRKYTKRSGNKKNKLEKIRNNGPFDLPPDEQEKRRREADAIRKRQKRHLMTEEERKAYLQRENDRKRMQRLQPSYDRRRAQEALRKKKMRANMSDAEREAFRKKDAARKRKAREMLKAKRQNLKDDQTSGSKGVAAKAAKVRNNKREKLSQKTPSSSDVQPKKRGRKPKYENLITESKPEKAKAKAKPEIILKEEAEVTVIEQFMNIIELAENEENEAKDETLDLKLDDILTDLDIVKVKPNESDVEVGKIIALPDNSCGSVTQSGDSFNGLFNTDFPEDFRLPYDGSPITTLCVPDINAPSIELNMNTPITLVMNAAVLVDNQIDTLIESSIVEALESEAPKNSTFFELYNDLDVKDGRLGDEVQLISSSQSRQMINFSNPMEIHEIYEDENGKEIPNYVPSASYMKNRLNKKPINEHKKSINTKVLYHEVNKSIIKNTESSSIMKSFDKDFIKYQLLKNMHNPDTDNTSIDFNPNNAHKSPKTQNIRINLKRIRIPERNTEPKNNKKRKKHTKSLSHSISSSLSSSERLDLFGFRGFPESESETLLTHDNNEDDSEYQDTNSSTTEDSENLIFDDENGFRGFPESDIDLVKESKLWTYFPDEIPKTQPSQKVVRENESITLPNSAHELIANNKCLDEFELANLSETPPQNSSVAQISKLQNIIANESSELPVPSLSVNSRIENDECHSEQIPMEDNIIAQPHENPSVVASIGISVESNAGPTADEELIACENSLQPIQNGLDLDIENEGLQKKIPAVKENVELPSLEMDFIDFETLIMANHITDKTVNSVEEDREDAVTENISDEDHDVEMNATQNKPQKLSVEKLIFANSYNEPASHMSADVELPQNNLTLDNSLEKSLALNQINEDLSHVQTDGNGILMQAQETFEDSFGTSSAGHIVQDVISNKINHIAKEILVTTDSQSKVIENSTIEQGEKSGKFESLRVNTDKISEIEKKQAADNKIANSFDNTSAKSPEDNSQSDMSFENGSEEKKIKKKIKRLVLLLKETTENVTSSAEFKIKEVYKIKKKIKLLQKLLPTDTSTEKADEPNAPSPSSECSSLSSLASIQKISVPSFSEHLDSDGMSLYADPVCSDSSLDSTNRQNSEASKNNSFISLPEESSPQNLAEKAHDDNENTANILLYETDDGYEAKMKVPNGHRIEHLKLSRKTSHIRNNRSIIRLSNIFPEGKTAAEYLKNCDLELLS